MDLAYQNHACRYPTFGAVGGPPVRLLIRADGDREIGTGHVMRTMALAEAVLAGGGSAVLASASIDPALATRVGSLGVTVSGTSLPPGGTADAEWTITQASRAAAEWVVVDGYDFGPAYLERLASAGLRVLLLDDYAPWERYPVQLVLNQNVLATPSLYPAGARGLRYLLGPGYALLREEIAAGTGTPPVTRDHARRILVTLGGADPPNASRRILDALRRLPEPDLEIRVILGPSNQHGASFMEAAGDSRVSIIPPVREMAPLLRWADVAITGAGSTVYELACLGIPTLVVAIAEYQRNLAAALERAGLALSLGWHDVLQPAALAATVAGLLGSPAIRQEMSRRGVEVVDGRGVGRVLDAMRSA